MRLSTLRYSVIVFIAFSVTEVVAGTFKIDGPFEGCQIGKLYPLQNRGILECQENFYSLQFSPVVESNGQVVVTIGGNHIDALLHDGVVIRTSINDVFNGCEFGKEIEFTNQMVLVCSEHKYTYTYQPNVVIFLFTNSTPQIFIDNENFAGELYYSSNQVKTKPTNFTQSPDYLDNLATCLKGSNPASCNHSMLTADDVERVRQAEYRSNLATCLKGSNPASCNHSMLTADDVERVRQAEYRSNLATCLKGIYPASCDHSILTADDVERVRQAEYRSNLATCLKGIYPASCDHSILTADDVERVRQAEYRSNLATCLKGIYPTLCDHSILTAGDVERVRQAEYRSNKMKQERTERERLVAERLQRELEEKARRTKLEEQQRQAALAEKLRRQDEELKKQQEIERKQRLERRAQSEFSKYLPEIKSKVINSWNPLGDRKNRQAILDVEIDPLGEVQSVEIFRSSGSLPFDRSVTNAIRKASPLPIPKDREIFEIIKKFRFRFTEPSG